MNLLYIHHALKIGIVIENRRVACISYNATHGKNKYRIWKIFSSTYNKFVDNQSTFYILLYSIPSPLCSLFSNLLWIGKDKNTLFGNKTLDTSQLFWSFCQSLPIVTLINNKQKNKSTKRNKWEYILWYLAHTHHFVNQTWSSQFVHNLVNYYFFFQNYLSFTFLFQR